MFRIGIVEDEKDQFEYIAEQVRAWGKINSVPTDIVYVANAEEYLFKYEGQDPFDLLFLDVYLKRMDGMELARRVRAGSRTVDIVFLTNVSDYVFEGYEIGAVRYLLKPVDREKIFEVLELCAAKKLRKPEDFFSFQYLGELIRVWKGDIIRFQVEGHYVRMVTGSRVYEWKESLKNLAARLDRERFVAANRSAIVNLDYVSKITRERCVLENGEEIPVSRGAYAGLNDAFMRYYID